MWAYLHLRILGEMGKGIQGFVKVILDKDEVVLGVWM